MAPEPPKMMLPVGTREVSELVAESVRLATGVSVSPTVKGIAEEGVSSLMLRSAIGEIVGEALALTVKVKES